MDRPNPKLIHPSSRNKTRMMEDENADTSGILNISSNSTYSRDRWDPTRFRLASGKSTTDDQVSRGRRVKRIKGQFIKGPLPVIWLARARRLGVSALWAGLALLYLRGLRQADSVKVSNLHMDALGLKADAKSRALRALEQAGLISVERRGKRSPVVTLLLANDIDPTHKR